MATTNFVIKNGLTVSNSFVANTSGIFANGNANVASLTLTNVVANSSGIWTAGLVNASSITSTSFTANASGVFTTFFTSNSSGIYLNGQTNVNNNLIIASGYGVSANGSYGASGQALLSNGSSVYWATATAGSNTQIQFNDSQTANASAGFTFNKTSNNIFVANSIGLGTSSPIRTLHVAKASNAEQILEQTDGKADWRKWNFVVDSGNTSTASNFSLRLLNDAGSSATLSVFDIVGATGAVRINNSLGVGTVGSSVQGEIRATNNITAYYSSDRRLKENIEKLSNALEKLNKINGVSFDWNDEFISKRGGEDGYFVRKHDVGVIAQEVEEILPEIVATREDGYKAVNYEKLVPLLIEAIKELSAKVDSKSCNCGCK
jgi:hypothetical protein